MQLIQQCSDSELVHAFILGDEKALETLVYRYKDKIYTSIYMLVKDKYMAEDIFQDAFLKMVRTMREGRYSEQGKFLPWAIRVAHNLCMDHFRKVKQNVQILLPDGKDISDLLGADTQGASDRIETRQVNQSIRQPVSYTHLVVRTNKNSNATSVNVSFLNAFSTVDTGDMQLLTTSVTFTSTSADTQYISIKIKNDALKEVAEYFGIELNTPVNAVLGLSLIHI